jgi:hypothetical protein
VHAQPVHGEHDDRENDAFAEFRDFDDAVGA